MMVADLIGYEFETLRDDGEFLLHRARRSNNPLPVLAVVARRKALIKRLEHEYALADDLESDWAARPLALLYDNGSATLVLEDAGGDPLDRLLGKRLELTQFLSLAINLTAAVGQVHRRGLIHKDLKPANVLVDAGGNVRLTGFGIASRLARERQVVGPAESIAGTLAYIAPEQTGRMNRSVDARSDLYALGVTLYEMLTGVLPFAASDPMEWIHCHVARLPVPADERSAGIAAQLSSIVMKLLAKNAEDRYQTAAGLEADLQRCLRSWEAHRRIDAFKLGARDGSDRLLIPEKLYGREAEVGELVAAYDRVVHQGATELVLVSGYSGVGKSSIVNELHKSLAPARGLFAAGKFDQYKRDIPYATLAQAFRSLVRQLLAKSETEISQWRQALAEALGPNGRMVIDLIPELSHIVGEQPAIAELSPQDRQNRFLMVFRRFLGVFARPEHPLVLFFDDLQWLDAASLELLEHLVAHPDVKHLLLVAAYRDNELSSAHPLMPTLASLSQVGARLTQIILAPLGPVNIDRLVADALRCDLNVARPLADLAYEKSAGNPFFTIQFLKALAEEALMAFNPVTLAWQWDIEQIRAKSFSDNVVELMAYKLKRLSKETRLALQRLAYMGNNCKVATLSKVYGETEQQIHAACREAVEADLVRIQTDSYIFQHDRVQEAAYALIPEQERAAAHLRIGRMLSSLIAPQEFEENIFEIVNHLDRGVSLITDPEEREDLAELNLIAGRRAKSASAYASALSYLVAGSAVLAEDRWERTYPLAFALELHRAECEYLIGDLASSEVRLTQLSGRATNRVDEAAVAFLRVDLYTNMDQTDKAIEVGRNYLQRTGIVLPAQATAEHLRSDYKTLCGKLGTRSIESLVHLPPMNDPDQRGILNVLSALVPPANFSDGTLGRIISIRMAILSLEHGNGDASGYGYVCVGMLLGPFFDDYESGYRFSKVGLQLTEQHDRFRARVYQTFSNHVAPWMQHLPACRVFVRRAFDAAQEVGDLSFAAYSHVDLVTNFLASGEPLGEVEQEAENALAFARKLKFGLLTEIVTGQIALIRNLRGFPSELTSLEEETFEEGQFDPNMASDHRLAKPMGCYWIRKLQACFFADDYASALVAASKASTFLWTLVTDFERAEYDFYGALTRAVICDQAPPDQRQQHLEALSSHHRQMTIWENNCPETFGARAALLGAEIARLEGRELDAEHLYEKAIKAARKHGFVQNEGVANEQAARFYMARGFDKIGDTYLREARDCYRRWGADGKVRQLDRNHPHLRRAATLLASTTTFDAPVEQLDMGTMFKAMQALSGEIVLDALIETLMRMAIEHAGAERGVLILLRNNEPQIAAEAAVSHGKIHVELQERPVSGRDIPESALDYVARTRARLIIDDATASNLLSDDDYVRQRRPKSILCLPVVKQDKLVGALFLENNLTTNAFTPNRISVLEFLASQAAISLENAYLYADLARSEAFLSEGQRMSKTGSWSWTLSTGKLVWSEEHSRIFGYDRADDSKLEFGMFLERLHPEDRPFVQQRLDTAIRNSEGFAFDFRLGLPDGSVKHVHGVGRPILGESGEVREYVGTTIDLTERKRSEDALRKAQADLMRVSRLTTMGELAGSIAHEVNQPLGAILMNSETGLRVLARPDADIAKAGEILKRVAADAKRASEIIDRIRAMATRRVPEQVPLSLADVIEESITFLRYELQSRGISVRLELAPDLPQVVGDRTQLQQVVMNLAINAVQAMAPSEQARPGILIRTVLTDDQMACCYVEDSGPGIDPSHLPHLFDSFFTTKDSGIGLGLAISRSIIEAHRGHMRADNGSTLGGARFGFMLPANTA
jgi:PAS domain S-box-containing protein